MKTDTSRSLECMKTGESYRVDADLLRMQQKCADKLLKINRLPLASCRRERLLSSLFASYGSNNVIKNGLQCNYGFNISVGDNCYFNYNLVILDSFEVSIGSNVFIAPNVCISPVTHPLKAEDRRNLIFLNLPVLF